MELLSSPSLSSYCSFTCKQSTSTSKECSSSFIRISNRKSSFRLSLKLTSQRLQPSNFTVEAVVGDANHATAVPNDSTMKSTSEIGEENVNDSGDPKMIRICDKLIEVFMVDKPNPVDWRRLLAFSKEWETIRPHFFERCQDRADKEDDPGMKHKLFRLGRKLKEVDEDVQRHNELLQVVKNSPSEIGNIVAKRRKDFTKEFFMHLHAVAESYHDNEGEQNVIAKVGNTCLAAVEAYDTATESIEAINAAELKFQDIINSPSVDAACRKIDNLAEKNQLDSALVLMITKAWSAAKETNMMKDEVKDILYHLYMTARGNLQRLMPKEVRIVKYLLTIEDPERLLCALNDAFTPGDELEGQDFDNLYTTPEKLHTWIKAVVNAYHFSREGTLVKEARDLMNPKIIQKMEEIEKLIRDKFMGAVFLFDFWGFQNSRTMTRKSSTCAFCENSNLASICTVCVNYRVNSYGTNLTSLKSRRDSLYSKLSEVLVAKSKADDQISWRILQHEKLATLREKLHFRKEQLSKDKAKVEKTTSDLKVRYELLESAMDVLEKNRKEQLEKYYPNLICTQSLGHMAITSERLHKQSVVIKQICKLFPQRKVNIDGERKDGLSGQYDQICNAKLPRGLDPHSVPSDELAASLGYMVQLLNLIVHNVGAPALHNSGFAGSCSRIWQRDSYWDARPSSRSNEYPLFIPRQNFCTTGVETSWSDKSSSNFGVASMESEKKARLESSSSFSYTSASPHSLETHMDLQKGISLLKKSVACVTAYCYNSLCLEVPPDASTFEAFAKLLAMLSSSKEVRTAVSLKMACSRSSKQVQQLNYSVWNVNSAISSTTLLESTHTSSSMRSTHDKSLSSSASSYLYANDMITGAHNQNGGKKETLTEGWDLVEHPTLPPPPSHTEDVEHWTRAMFIDATKK
ncbi:unnamed protein product [Lactuca virosa]|uniref:Uncharacterized protein n=1 Tax=Lactuca virosa TaxID=75947 RepID=A0AAU9PXC5_9ASTR|nr:unnamed protein product [Lactuca virosa]